MAQSRNNVLAIRIEPARLWTSELLQGTLAVVQSTGVWAVDAAQQFGSVLSALMAPAVLSTYSFAAWSLAANLGWTNSFPYAAGPFSNWFVWASIAIAVHVAAHILHRRTSER